MIGADRIVGQRRPRPVIGMLQRELSGLYAEQWLGAVDAARVHGCDLICFSGRRLADPGPWEQANVIYDLATPATLDGVVIWTTALGSLVGPEVMAPFGRRFDGLPVVSVEEPLGSAPVIVMGNRRGMYTAVRHLMEVHGRRRIGFIRGAAEHTGAQERFAGYLDALTEDGLAPEPGLVSAPTQVDGVPEAVTRMLEAPAPPDAIVAAHDDYAVAVLSTLAAAGIGTPEDIAVVGFDDRDDLLPGGALESTLDPGFEAADDDESRARRRDVDLNILSLTTVRAPFHELGHRAVEILLDLLRGEPVPPVTEVDTELIVRRTCGCIPVAPHDQSPGPSTDRLRRALTRRSVLPDDWPEQLSAAFDGELTGAAPGRFPALLDRYVQLSLWSGEPVENWWQVLLAVRQLTGPHPAGTPRAARAEDLWLHAELLLNQAAKRYWRYEKVLTERHNQIVRDVGQQLITAPDVAGLAGILAGELPKLGIPTCYLAAYEPSGGARQLLAYENGVRQELPDDPPVFDSPRLVPGDQLARGPRRSMVALPLYFQDQQLGFALLELGPHSVWLYPALQEQLSTALHRVFLVERERAARAALEEAHRRAERHRLAGELHDSISQALFSMTLQTRAAQLALTQDGADPNRRLARGLAELQQLISGALSEMRSLIFQLRPEALHEGGLVAAIRTHAAAVAAREGLDVEVLAPEDPLPLSEQTEEELFRVVQEALHNTVKHAGARRVEIRLTEPADAPGTLVVEVADDGTGFDPDLPRPGHLGLELMRERAARLGGELIVDSAPTRSTTIRTVLPGALRAG
jgi:signal transduction histidine kinase/DNA-binding LacI/PurR family transcriptional regulator